MERDTTTNLSRTVLSRLAVAILVALVGFAGVTAAGTSPSLYYQEVVKDGRIYVFNSPDVFRMWQQTGEMGKSITLVGAGPNGETVVGDNETAIDLFNFKHDLPGYERPKVDEPKPKPSFPQVKIGALWYLSYQDGTAGGDDFSKFTIKRGYVNIEAKVNDFLSARITPDVTQDSSGDLKVRLKYAYAKFHLPETGFITQPEVEVGIVHMPWLDFEEHINHYRMQDTMFMERNGMFNSADAGITVMGLLGGKVSEDHQKHVSKYYPGRWGSFAFGIYNGGGYHASEANDNKALEGRLTVRPLPDVMPGVQLSYFGVRGKGNVAAEPDFDVNALMASFESERIVATATWMDATGNQKGSAVDASGRALDRDGWSVFAEGKLDPRWSVIGRYDEFDPNTDAQDDASNRTIFGVAYHLGGGNTVLLDWDKVSYDLAGKDSDDRLQLTLQVKY